MVTIAEAVEQSSTFKNRLQGIASASDAQGSFQRDYSNLRHAMTSAVTEACAEKSGYILGFKPAQELYTLYSDFAKRGLMENAQTSIDAVWYADVNALRALAQSLPVERAKARR